MIFIPIFREITSCFRHLEKPIKTKEHKIKHLFLYVFIGFPLFFRRRKQIASRRADGELKLINVFCVKIWWYQIFYVFLHAISVLTTINL